VLGKSVWLRTRYAYDCVLDRLSWDSPIWLTHKAEGELRFWLENIEKMNFEGSYFSQLTEIKEVIFYHQTDIFTFLKCVSSIQSIVKIHYDSNAL
jgi:hypothetical protein